jgi:hypothetical protein
MILAVRLKNFGIVLYIAVSNRGSAGNFDVTRSLWINCLPMAISDRGRKKPARTANDWVSAGRGSVS